MLSTTSCAYPGYSRSSSSKPVVCHVCRDCVRRPNCITLPAKQYVRTSNNLRLTDRCSNTSVGGTKTDTNNSCRPYRNTDAISCRIASSIYHNRTGRHTNRIARRSPRGPPIHLVVLVVNLPVIRENSAAKCSADYVCSTRSSTGTRISRSANNYSSV